MNLRIFLPSINFINQPDCVSRIIPVCNTTRYLLSNSRVSKHNGIQSGPFSLDGDLLLRCHAKLQSEVRAESHYSFAQMYYVPLFAPSPV